MYSHVTTPSPPSLTRPHPPLTCDHTLPSYVTTPSLCLLILQTKSIVFVGLFSNRMFLFAVGGSLVGQLLVVYFPPLQQVFQTEALTVWDLLFLLLLCSSVLIVDETRKLVQNVLNRHKRSQSNMSSTTV